MKILKKGNLIVATGCMFAGKTTKLIELAHRYTDRGDSIKVFRPDIDKRYSVSHIVSHDGKKIPAYTFSLEELRNIDASTRAVFFDEIQFYNEEVLTLIPEILEKGIDVIVSGLNTDFKGLPFPIIKELMPIADDVFHLKAVCSVCKYPATMTQRLVDGRPAKFSDPIVLVGGSDCYEARCRTCHVVEM